MPKIDIEVHMEYLKYWGNENDDIISRVFAQCLSSFKKRKKDCKILKIILGQVCSSLLNFVLVVIYQARKKVFDHISKHRGEC